MSRYEWEKGTFKLPSAEFARMRQAMQDHDAKVKTAAHVKTQEFWKGLTRKEQTDPTAYSEALSRWNRARYDRQNQAARSSWGMYSSSKSDATKLDEEAGELASDLMERRTRGAWNQEKRAYDPPKPSRVLASEMEMPTNRTTSFSNGYDGSISFDKKAGTVTWHVGENNHAVDSARESSYGQRFFSELGKVRWTRGTGGVIVGNDEYNQDNSYAGGGGNYVTTALGPLGMAEAPEKCEDWTDPQGKRFTVEVSVGRYGGWRGKAVEVDRWGNKVAPKPRPKAAAPQAAPARPGRAAAPGAGTVSDGMIARHGKGSSKGGQFAKKTTGEAGITLEER